MRFTAVLPLVIATLLIGLVSAVPYQVISARDVVIYNLGIHTKSRTSQGCTSTTTKTSIKTYTPRIYTSSITATNTTTIIAPTLTVTANSTALLTFTSTTTTILTTTDTVTSTVLALPTYTVPAPAGWLPILSSLPDSSFDGSVLSKRGLLEREEVESTNSTKPDSSIKSTTTSSVANQCAITTITVPSTTTLPTSTLRKTVFIVATAISTPVSTTITLITTLNLTTTAVVSSTTGVTTTTTLTTYANSTTTSTFYAACATANIATSFGGVPIRAVGGDNGDGYYRYKKTASSYDCCVLAMTSNLLPRFFNYLQNGDCYLLYQQGETNGTCVQAAHEMSVLASLKGNSVFGNALCGRFTSGSVDLNYG